MFIVLLCTKDVFAQDQDSWQFVLTPTIWNASVEARLSDSNSGGIDLPIDPDYRFFTLDNLDDYLSLKFEANHGRFGILFDSLRARYQDQTDNTFVNAIVASELGFIELSARYQLLDKHELNLIGGVRRSFLDINMRLVPGPAFEQSYSWTDPLIGMRYHYPISHNWHVWLRGDIGGFNVGTQRSINATADIQYILNSSVSFTMGYRYLDIKFKEDDVLYDVVLDGLYLGVGIHF